MNTGKVTLNAVGDICLGDSLISLGFGIRSTVAQKGPGFLFEPSRHLLEDADFLFGNLECVLSDYGRLDADPKTQYLRGEPSAIEALTPLGFDVLNVANNHTLQYGRAAWDETLGLVRGAGIGMVGIAGERGDGDDYHSRPVVLEKDGLKIGLLGYSYEWEQYFEGDPLYAVGDREPILADLARLKDAVDFTVVSVHWGLEYMSHPRRDAVDLAHKLVEAGADAVLGHHPHVLQGTERYRDGVIAYSLGNFIFDKMWWGPCLDTVIARLTFTPGPERRVDLEMIPLRINRYFQPEPLQGHEDEAARRKLKALDARVQQDRERSALPYGLRQKIILQMLNVTKLGHILGNLGRYPKLVRNHLLLRKVLRIP